MTEFFFKEYLCIFDMAEAARTGQQLHHGELTESNTFYLINIMIANICSFFLKQYFFSPFKT